CGEFCPFEPPPWIGRLFDGRSCEPPSESRTAYRAAAMPRAAAGSRGPPGATPRARGRAGASLSRCAGLLRRREAGDDRDAIADRDRPVLDHAAVDAAQAAAAVRLVVHPAQRARAEALAELAAPEVRQGADLDERAPE